MASLNTSDPNALRYFLNEILYSFEMAPAATEIAPTLASPLPTYTYLGENRKNFLFILNHEQDAFFSPPALDAFSKTITALGLTLADIAVYNLAASPAPLNTNGLFHFFKPKKLVFSGVSPVEIGLVEKNLNSVFQHGNCSCLFTYSFEEMLTDTQKKKLFWSQLKTV